MVHLKETIQSQGLNDLTEQLLKQLKNIGYKASTLAAYKCALKKVSKFMEERNIAQYTPNVGILFLDSYLPKQKASTRWNKYIKTSIRRLDDYLLGKPYTIMHPAKNQKLPDLFLTEYKAYVEYMIMKGFRPSTIETRKIYASQFLVSLEVQGLTALSQLSAGNLGQALMSSGSKEGFCEKVPTFLKYLYETKRIELDFSSVVPRFHMDLTPQNSANPPFIFFHFFDTFLSFSSSSVARAFNSCSIVMSIYTIVVWSCSCPNRKEICTIFMPSSNQWEALACLS